MKYDILTIKQTHTHVSECAALCTHTMHTINVAVPLGYNNNKKKYEKYCFGYCYFFGVI